MKLPPLTALRHFNAAATHLSFRQAAEELCVTEGAVSRQMKLLEGYFDTQLFERVARGVRLTDAGLQLHAGSGAALQQIAAISDELLGAASQFTLSVTTSFAIRWLLPRLNLFEQAYPNYPINLQAVKDPTFVARQQFDASIIYALGNPFDTDVTPPTNGHRIMVEWLQPVCSPTLLDGSVPLSPMDLEQFRIIFNEHTGRDWRHWLGVMTSAKVRLETALRFEHDDTAIQAAVAGHGIALANMAYIRNELEMGSLVPAVGCDPLPIGAHYLVSSPSKSDLPQVKAFRQWIIDCAAEDDAP